MKQDYRTLLTQNRLRVTPARLDVLAVFGNKCEPRSAEDVWLTLKNKNTNVVTVYRTLASLEKAGIIKRIDLRKDSTHYELADHHHHHVTCTRCGRTEGFKYCNIKNIAKTVLKKSPHFTSVDQHSIELFGVCTPCARRHTIHT